MTSSNSKKSVRLDNWRSDLVLYIIITIVTFIMVYPFLYILAISLSDPNAITSGLVTIFPVGFNVNLYKYIFMLPTVTRGYLNSLLYTSLGILISVIMTVLCAYPLSKKWLPGRPVIAFMIIITMFVNGGLIPTFLTVKMLGLYNTIWAFIIPGCLSAFLVMVSLTFFRTLPIELEEAAFVDGADEFTILTRIILPLSKPLLATLAIYYGVGYWNSWFPAAIYFKDTSLYPIQLVLRNVMIGMGIGNTEMTAVFGDTLRQGGINVQALNYSLIVAVAAPIILIYPFVQKYFVKGITVGAIKG